MRTSDGDGADEFIINYSSGGCCLTTPVVYRKGEAVLIIAPQAPTLVNRSRGYRIGRVVWDQLGSDGTCIFGISFTDHSANA
ncbi:MAG: hypothetical protein A2487_03985 [Candidatus Raymondbacteria bacterium RifOxyC12_full_50_8]|uniref:PilZ domain-containing protein n=1 Tax=Candidatus Raymondbacteria bacterium RIFOXYD12_FULL_49_13 TaxID=1817890 RepID=A0A1F7FGL2_UNCRA|nr:MAG: hypothetical protein A2248_04895 [Candidatus Raymondbacteria bacterium RIFOXYA2_FULL_49_16]OGK00675.1 MAG: hypothetical protein A2350_00575 [Candidatus Raymondbacteria bacterium RifOxyB12_full_50_8]OGK03078.1 MAG: hypothetical protein A2487_03985 [Candidatus Raymondbacteria bacterium RifOxyC12_full_50_8]OGK05834.1 MAG: hypothetical protein A2519_04070 [Candidatus Raymondbacteria bacterium RIFOXYD12_FULL_49_13]OGP43327.1 MAG: hypothetical protein A2324_02535 [Candidatus Raymondbacteria b